MRYRVLIKIETSLICLVAVVSVGCAKLITEHLQPAVVAQDCTSDHDSASTACWTPCGLAEFGGACTAIEGSVPGDSLKEFPSPGVPPVVGWGDRYDAGTDPCPCWEWVSTFSRGYVRFDLTKLIGPVDSIESAAVSWKTKRLHGGSAKSCAKYLYEATGPWKRGETPANLLFENLDTTAVSGGYYGVAKQAVNWWANPNENYGLMFEPSRAKTVSNSNSECEDALENLSLTVKYRQKDVKWPGQ